LKFNPGHLDQQDLKYVHLTGKRNPKTRALARDWKEVTDNTEQFVALALDYFKNNEFTYTLDAPPVRGNIIDDFLFRTRSGYCEHYASAFALLMHEANIPARVIGGYLGGVVNPYGNYLIVRQSDAHVWTEVWHEGKGWIRIDPTSIISPERVEQSDTPEDYGNLRLGWDALNNQWNVWFFSYTFYRQKRFLANIGFELDSWFDPIKLVLLIICITGIFLLVFVFLPLNKRSKTQDRVLLLYNKFCEKLARIGYPRKPAQGPVDYANHVSAARQDLSTDVHDITNLYILLRYDRGSDDETLNSFKNKIKRFKPRSTI